MKTFPCYVPCVPANVLCVPANVPRLVRGIQPCKQIFGSRRQAAGRWHWGQGRAITKCLLFLSAIVLLLLTSNSVAETLYPLPSEKQNAQFHHLLKELRCLVCQNQDLADSSAGLAKDLRNQVYEMVQRGDSDSEIVRYLTDRYGDFILFKPPMKGITALLWFGPALFLLLGLFIFWRTCLVRRNPDE